MPSATFIKATQALTTEEEFTMLVRITHPDIDPVAFPDGVCLCDVNSDTVSNGITYVAYPIEIPLPEMNPEQLPRGELVIDNIDPAILNGIRLLQGTKPRIELSMVLASTPDTVEVGPYYFEITDTPWDRYTVVAKLNVEPLLNRRWPKDQITPATHPGVF